jgi:hypothetical protein
MQFVLAVPEPIIKYVVGLARLGALDYARAQDEEKLHLPHAANEDHASQIRAQRDRYVERWANKKQQIADILAPYRSFNQTP